MRKQSFSILVLLILSLNCIYGQQEFVFYANVNDYNKLDVLLQKSDINSSTQFISLGDNSNLVGQNIAQQFSEHKQHHLLGDKQLLLENIDKVGDDKQSKTNFCPEPRLKELDDNTVMVLLNSTWFMDRELHYLPFNQKCNCYNRLHILELIDEVLDDYPDHHKIFVAHHGIKSISEISGRGLVWNNFIPLAGQLYNGYRKHIGKETDIASTNYKHYSESLSKLFSSRDNVTFISGHDEVNSYFTDASINNINVNSGSDKGKFRATKTTTHIDTEPAILKLYKAGNQWQVRFIGEQTDQQITLKQFKNQGNAIVKQSYPETPIKETYRASERYLDPSGFKQKIMGSGYRAEWSQNIKAPHLQIDTLDGGAVPYTTGGGLQTMSIKLKSANGKKYAFRLLDKRPEKSLSELANESVYRSIVIDLITTMHPYGPLVANHLLDQTDIIHIKPELYVLEDNSQLKGKYAVFVGKLGTLEEKPKGEKKGRPGFANSDKVVSSFEMLAEIRNSEHHKMDKMSYAKARLMDMYIGDWDRHEDNWKWAVFKDGKKKIYKPIPKDRDHVFSKWSGLIPSIADVAVPNAEDFDYDFKNLRQLNFKGRFIDRAVGSELSLADWHAAADYLQNSISDEAIAEAVTKIPVEARTYHTQEIKEKLISRRGQLHELVTNYYQELNAFVDITGTNRKDKFLIHSLDRDTIAVSVYHKGKKKPYFTRKIETALIEKVYLFGLGDVDNFVFDLREKTNCKFYVIGGDGKDVITPKSNQSEQSIVVYDSENKDDIVGSNNNIKIKSPTRHAHYEPGALDYNWLKPKVWVKRSSGNGSGYLLGATYFTRGFNKPLFASKIYGQFIHYPSINSKRVKVHYTKRHVHKLWDLRVETMFSDLYDKFPFYYGIGNDTEFDRDNRVEKNRIDYDIAKLQVGLQKTIFTKSELQTNLSYAYHSVKNFEGNNVLDESDLGEGKIGYLNFNNNLEFDFTDNTIYPTDGAQLYINSTVRYSKENDITSNIAAKFNYYKSAHLGVLVTFAGGIGYSKSFGNSSFYHLSPLGSSSHFRGYNRNRFLDENALVLNTELRIRLGTIKTPLVKFVVGIHGLWDHGKVWGEVSDYSDSSFKDSYGGGFFIAPGDENYTISYYLLQSDDDDLYTKIQLGFDF